MESPAASPANAGGLNPAPSWQPLASIPRRVLGVLIEKGKTTPDAYPMTLNGIRTGCNQKSNREPTMNLDEDQVEEALETLRGVGVVSEIQGSGRVSKYRHFAYTWLGVDKVECAIMAELLLRGEQTEGELRGRAARMEPIADLNVLRPLLQGLKQRGLIVALTPEGRGHIVTHNLYLPHELDKVRARVSALPMPPEAAPMPAAAPAPRPAAPMHSPAVHSHAAPAVPVANVAALPLAEIELLREELKVARGEIAQLRSEFDDLSTEFRRGLDEIDRLKQALGG